MKTKTIVTVALLLFVAASVAYVVVEQLRSTSQSAPAQPNPSVPQQADPAAVEENLQPPSRPQTSKVVLYYFRGNVRCPTCRKFEAYSDEVLQQTFANELHSGSLEWQVINVEEPGNKHFINDYRLFSKSLVLVKFHNGRQAEWKNLTRIWELVRNKDAFVQYIQDEVIDYLGAG